MIQFTLFSIILCMGSHYAAGGVVTEVNGAQNGTSPSTSSIPPLAMYTTTSHSTCPAGYQWEPETKHCYKFHRDALAFRLALAKCHSEGGLLAIINSAVESTILKTIFDKNPGSLIVGAEDTNYAFVGFRKYEDDEWATLYGDLLANAGFDTWENGAPAAKAGNCGVIDRQGLLHNVPCTKNYAFICKVTLVGMKFATDVV